MLFIFLSLCLSLDDSSFATQTDTHDTPSPTQTVPSPTEDISERQYRTGMITTIIVAIISTVMIIGFIVHWYRNKNVTIAVTEDTANVKSGIENQQIDTNLEAPAKKNDEGNETIEDGLLQEGTETP